MKSLVRAEWIKFSSLRSSWTLLGFALVLNGVFVAFSLWTFDRTAGDVAPDTSVISRVSTMSAGDRPCEHRTESDRLFLAAAAQRPR